MIPKTVPVVHVPTLRRSCEHVCLVGAFADVLGSVTNYEVAWVVFIGKLAVFAGALAVTLLHVEEHQPLL